LIKFRLKKNNLTAAVFNFLLNYNQTSSQTLSNILKPCSNTRNIVVERLALKPIDLFHQPFLTQLFRKSFPHAVLSFI
jgi:hypothetical protein